jgi:hypothetical protein
MSVGGVVRLGIQQDGFSTGYIEGRFGVRVTPATSLVVGQIRAGVGMESSDGILIPSVGYAFML